MFEQDLVLVTGETMKAGSLVLFANRLNTIILFIILVVIVFVMGSVQPISFDWMYDLGVLSSVLLLDMIVFTYLKTRRVLSFRLTFLVLSFLFHLGYTWIFLFNPGFSFQGMDFRDMFEPAIVIKSFLFSLSVLLALYLGIEMGDRKPSKLTRSVIAPVKLFLSNLKISRVWTEVSYRNLGLAILAISLPFRLYIDTTKVFLGQSQDYLATFDLEVNGYISTVADLTVVGVVLLLAYFRNNKRIALIILVLSTSYYLYTMGSGSRGGAMISVLALMIAYQACLGTFRKRTLLIIGFLSLFLVSYITSIGITRVESTPQLDAQFGTASRFLHEFGGTQLTTILTMQFVERNANGFADGETYLASLASITPNISTEIDTYINDNNLPKLLNYPTIGGSFIAEMYYNFGMFSILAAFIVGCAVGRFDNALLVFSRTNRFVLLALAILIVKQSLWWIRDTALVFPRHFVIGFLVITIMTYVLYRFGYIKLSQDARVIGTRRVVD